MSPKSITSRLDRQCVDDPDCRHRLMHEHVMYNLRYPEMSDEQLEAWAEDWNEYAELGGPEGIDNINYQIEQAESNYEDYDYYVDRIYD